MRCFDKAKLIRKFNRLRKQNWSAPAAMSFVCIIFMFFIFCFENLGLLNKNNNLMVRLSPVMPDYKNSSEETFHNLEIAEPEVIKPGRFGKIIQTAPTVGGEKTLYKQRVFRTKLSESYREDGDAKHKINRKKNPKTNEYYPKIKESNKAKYQDIQLVNKKENAEILNNMLLEAVEGQIDYEAYILGNNQTNDTIDDQNLEDQVESKIKHNLYTFLDESDEDLDDILNEIDVSNGN
jgi:hypothetical protein